MAHDPCPDCDYKDNEIEGLNSDIRAFQNELYHRENDIRNADNRCELLSIEIDQLTANLAEVSEYVQDLERALAEAHLMSPPIDGPTGRVGDPA